MKTIIEDRILVLKLFQFVGGIIAIIVGAVLLNSDTHNIATITLGAYGVTLEVSAISGVAVIIAGIFLLFRSGGGVKVENEKEGPFSQSKEKIKLTVDSYKNKSDE